MEFPSFINWISQFSFEGLLDDIFHFYLNCDRKLCKQTMETLIRRRIVWRLVWVSTVCTCPTKRTLGLNWLMFECSSASIFCEGELQMFSRTCACMQIRLSLGCTIVICMHDRMPASCLFCCFTSQVNSYGHCGTVSSPNHTFSWAGLNKRLTSISCTYFRL